MQLSPFLTRLETFDVPLKQKLPLKFLSEIPRSTRILKNMITSKHLKHFQKNPIPALKLIEINVETMEDNVLQAIPATVENLLVERMMGYTALESNLRHLKPGSLKKIEIMYFRSPFGNYEDMDEEGEFMEGEGEDEYETRRE